MNSDTDRLLHMIKTGCDGFVHVKKDRYEYASEVAEEKGRDEPNEEDELEGYRRMIDCAMNGGDIGISL